MADAFATLLKQPSVASPTPITDPQEQAFRQWKQQRLQEWLQRLQPPKSQGVLQVSDSTPNPKIKSVMDLYTNPAYDPELRKEFQRYVQGK